MAWHVYLTRLLPLTPLLLEAGEILGASRQNQLVHLANVGTRLKCLDVFSPLSGHFGLESEG